MFRHIFEVVYRTPRDIFVLCVFGPLARLKANFDNRGFRNMDWIQYER